MYQPHGKDMKKDYNRSWKIAEEYGKKHGIIVIPATEITKGMPPGHFNALFIKDAAPVMNADFKLAIEEAVGQGAFILWNHPGWRAQQPDTMKLLEFEKPIAELEKELEALRNKSQSQNIDLSSEMSAR